MSSIRRSTTVRESVLVRTSAIPWHELGQADVDPAGNCKLQSVAVIECILHSPNRSLARDPAHGGFHALAQRLRGFGLGTRTRRNFMKITKSAGKSGTLLARQSRRKTGLASSKRSRITAFAGTVATPEVKVNGILVPVDFSELSLKALRYGIALAQRFRTGMVLLHVVEPVPVLGNEVGYVDPGVYDVRAQERAATRQLSDWRKQIAGPTVVKTFVRVGNPCREIITVARKNGSDLIVIGTHGRTGLSHMLIGSTAERVVRLAPCPVLVVRERERDFIRPVAQSGAKNQRGTLEADGGRGVKRRALPASNLR